MAILTTNRDGGETDEKGHMMFLGNAFTGNILDGMTVDPNSPLGMSVVVATGNARIPYGTYAYTSRIDSAETVTVDTADVTNPRIDRLVLYMDRVATPSTASPNNPGLAKLMLVKGTPAGSPTRPSDGAVDTAVSNNPWIDLADVRVDAGVTQVSGTKITDKRTMTKPVIPAGGLVTADYAPASVTPEKRSGGFKVGVISGSTMNSTGNKSITGVGFKPKMVKFLALPSTGPSVVYSAGAMDETGTQYAYSTVGTTTGTTTLRREADNSLCLLNTTQTGTRLNAAEYVSMDADGFTINVTTAGTTGFAYEAYA